MIDILVILAVIVLAFFVLKLFLGFLIAVIEIAKELKDHYEIEKDIREIEKEKKGSKDQKSPPIVHR